tara:strand:+ start:33229 stop:34128 length:900 start_codon:yes stop_codon:yes gene_type:complete
MKNVLLAAFFGLLLVSCSGDDDGGGSTVGDCDQPTQFVEFNITQTSAVVEWQQEGAPSFIVEYGEQGFALGSGDQVTSTNLSAEITGLTLDTTYDYYIRAVCSSDNVSEFIGPENFTTLACEKVTNVEVFNITESSAFITFDLNLSTVEYEIEYGLSGFTVGSGTKIVSDGGVEVDDLSPDTAYDVYVRSICGEEVSEDSNVVTFTTLPACTAPKAFDGVALGSGNVGLGWDPSGETAWRLEYGLSGFALGTGDELNTSNNSIEVTGLQSGEVYEFYVQANCGSDGFSEFTGPLTIAVQ